jgi:hypothetical protein
MLIRRGLNRLWILFTVLWFVGVAATVWVEFKRENECRIAVLGVEKIYGNSLANMEHMPPGCSPYDDLLPEGGELVLNKLRYQYYWTFAVPIVVWLLGFGVLWVLNGFRKESGPN